ncbi:MAG: hypothetical protein IBX55_19405 [Methyloprofundus sp.]|nr:hypothetical protein [Methyloprofundus sp.]MBW6453962.1 hypothetical protein [Methyloprofundus sp.]
MHELTTPELYKALEYARSLDETQGREILDQFQADQPVLAKMIFSFFPMAISEQNPEMSHIFLDLCFDIICVYQHAFGKTPTQDELSPEWLEKQAELLSAQLQSLPKQKASLQEHFDQQVKQSGLINFINDSIDEFAAEDKKRKPAIKITETMLLIVMHLFSNIYTHSKV